MKTNSLKSAPNSTVKKQKFVGSTEFIDPATGELIPMQIVSIEDRDFNFHKVWLQNLLLSIDGISNQRLRLAFWILENLDSENKLVMTQQTIADRSEMGLATVKRTMNALQRGKPAFLQKINSGAYRVNPEVVWKGSFKARMGVCWDYSNTETANQSQTPQEEPTELPGQVDILDNGQEAQGA